MRPHLGKLTFVVRREALKQQLAGHQTQYSVAQEFELLVILAHFGDVLDAVGSSFGLHFMSQRAVSKGLAEQFRVRKVVFQRRFKLFEVFDLHRRTRISGRFTSAGHWL